MDHAQKSGLVGALAGFSLLVLVGIVVATVPDVSTVFGGFLLGVTLLLPTLALSRAVTA